MPKALLLSHFDSGWFSYAFALMRTKYFFRSVNFSSVNTRLLVSVVKVNSAVANVESCETSAVYERGCPLLKIGAFHVTVAVVAVVFIDMPCGLNKRCGSKPSLRSFFLHE